MLHANTGMFLLVKRYSLAFMALFLLSGCSGESDSVPNFSETGDRSFVSSGDAGSSDGGTANPEPITLEIESYEREEDYPNWVKLPLEFYTTSKGKNVGISVSLPADEFGNPAEGTFPTILVQTAYNMSLVSLPLDTGVLMAGPAPYFIKRGYAMVTVDALGSGVSEGGWELLGQDEQDAYGDAVDWIQRQDWSNGDIGVSGASYMGITSLFTAQQRPDAIKAVFAVVPLGDAQRGTVGTGGMVNGVFMKTWMTLTAALSVQNVPAALLNPQHMAQIMRSTREHAEQVDRYYLPLIQDALNGEDYIRYDSDFWRTRSPIENIDKITAPTFITGSLHDIFQRDEPLLYEQLAKNVDARLAIFDGDHVQNMAQAQEGSEALAPLISLMLKWFDQHLMGLDSGAENIPPVTQYVKHSYARTRDGFSTTTQWPHPMVTPERWYLHGDMSLTQEYPLTDETDQWMGTPEPAIVEFGKDQNNGLVFDVIPQDGSDCSVSFRQWTLGGTGIAFAPLCLFDNKEVEEGALNYETAPMAEDYYINGPIQADIWVDSSATEAVVSVRIDEVSPDGEAVLPISNGLLAATARAVNEDRSRYINGEMVQPYHYFTKEEALPVVPGEVFKMQIEIFPSSALVRKGHRLRVSISPSNQAQGVMNLIQQANAEGGVTTIHISPEYPSSVVLPIVPLGELN